MYEKTKVKEITITDELSRAIALEYYVTQKGGAYGVEIAKYFVEDGGGRVFAESESGGGISHDRAAAVRLAAILANNSVTPATLIYVVDDMADMWYTG